MAELSLYVDYPQVVTVFLPEIFTIVFTIGFSEAQSTTRLAVVPLVADYALVVIQVSITVRDYRRILAPIHRIGPLE